MTQTTLERDKSKLKLPDLCPRCPEARIVWCTAMKFGTMTPRGKGRIFRGGVEHGQHLFSPLYARGQV